MKAIHNQHLVEEIQKRIPKFQSVPTMDDTPTVHINDRHIFINTVDLSVNAICEQGQLPAQIAIYNRARDEAKQFLRSKTVSRLRVRVDGFAAVLDTHELSWEEAIFNDDDIDQVLEFQSFDHDIEGRLPANVYKQIKAIDRKAHILKLMASANVPEEAYSVLMAYMEDKGLKVPHLTQKLMLYFADWYESAIELAVAEHLPHLLQTVLDALEREKENRTERANARMVPELRHQNEILTTQLRDAQQDQAATVVMVFEKLGITIGDQRRSDLLMMGDLGLHILTSYNASKSEVASPNGGDDDDDFVDEDSLDDEPFDDINWEAVAEFELDNGEDLVVNRDNLLEEEAPFIEDADEQNGALSQPTTNTYEFADEGQAGDWLMDFGADKPDEGAGQQDDDLPQRGHQDEIPDYVPVPGEPAEQNE